MNQPNTKIILPEDFSPELLDCRNYISSPAIKKGSQLRQRIIYNYEFELFLGEEGTLFLDDSCISVTAGDIVFKKPGQVTYSIAPYRSLLIFFSIIGNCKDRETYDLLRTKEYQDLYNSPIIEKIPPVCHPEPTEAYSQLFYNVLNEYVNASYVSPLLLKSYLLQLLYNIYFWNSELLSKTFQASSPYYVKMKKVIKFIQHNYSSKIDLKTLSIIANLSPNYFHKLFTQMMNISPCEYLINVRVDKAKEFLLKTDMTIQQVSDSCGFENSSYFSQVFKKATKLSPRDFRKKYNI